MITNGSIEGGTGDLIADQTTGDLHWTARPTAPYWLDDTALFWRSTYKEMKYEVNVTPDTGWAGDQFLLLETDLTVIAISFELGYKVGSSGAAFKTWPGTLSPIDEADDYTFRLTTAPGKVQGRVTRFEMRIAALP